MTDYGGFGGFVGGREANNKDKFEVLLGDVFGELIKSDDDFCKRLWSSLANVDWHHENGDTAGYSFRAAGDLIAAIRGEGDYMDWYMSGDYAVVDGDVEEELGARGWSPVIL